MNERPHVFELGPADLRDLLADGGIPPYRADQVLDWIYRKQVCDPLRMTNVSKHDRELLGRMLRFTTAYVSRHQTASDGVQKLLLQFAGDGAGEAECVLIPNGQRRTACISSQIGCPVGCRFCASGLGGLEGNLTAGQMVEQVWQLGCLPGIGRATNVVFMGMGEPMANFEQVTRAAMILISEWAARISARRITISTVGLPAQIRRLAELKLPLTLAISLHAPNDELRRRLIPWAQFVSIDQLIEAGRYYFTKTGREVTLEYILLRQVNDRPSHARQLAQLARQLRSNVNLIRYNEVKGLPYARPTGDDVHGFQQILRRAGVNCHIRASRGRDIAAACGQLRVDQDSKVMTRNS